MATGTHHLNSEGGGFSPIRRWRAVVFYLLVVVAVSLGISQAVKQHRETAYKAQAARDAVGPAPVNDTRTTVMALRDYIRENVTRANYRSKGRPLLRDTAVETLNSG